MIHPRVVRDPAVMMGKPVIKGTRITVEAVLRRLGTGDRLDRILADYPQLTEADVHAAQAFAADYLAGEDIIAAE
jgi:uncharacterized protein (DUF433 family)